MRFGTDGVRGHVNSELNASDVLDLGRAAARVLGAELAVVGGDTRLSTPMLEAALVAGLASEGVEVVRLGVAPTPAVAFEAARLGAMGAVVSASHNPFHDNGVKLFSVGGRKLADSVESEIEELVARLGDPHREPARITQRHDLSGYVEHLLAIVDERALDGLRVVVDAANGAASHVAEAALSGAGARVTVINASPDGRNINHDCGATHPGALAAAVRASDAHVGIALDGDADRVIAVDELGNVVDGDHIIALCALDMRARGALRHDAVVVTVMTNLGFRLAMRDAGIAVVETPVGDRHVLEALASGGYSVGGEQSGHVIFPDHATTGDGLLTALLLLDVVQRRAAPLSHLARSAMSSFPQVLLNVRVAAAPPDVADLLVDEIADAQRQLGERGRVLIRASGTEPLVRVMVEAATDAVARATAERLAAQVAAHPALR